MEWGQGRYELIALQLLPAADVVIDIADPTGGETIVDVGCGTGNAALLAAERGATVVGIDPAERLLEVAAAAAEDRDLDAEFVPGEAESIPVSDAEADAIVSVFGVIFAPDPLRAAAELARVTKPAGRIVLAAWAPAGPISDAVRLVRRTVSEIREQAPPPTPFPWHEADSLSELFEPHGFSVSITAHSLRSAPRRSTSSCESRERITRLRSAHARCSSRPDVRTRFARGCAGSTRRGTRTRTASV